VHKTGWHELPVRPISVLFKTRILGPCARLDTNAAEHQRLIALPVQIEVDEVVQYALPLRTRGRRTDFARAMGVLSASHPVVNLTMWIGAILKTLVAWRNTAFHRLVFNVKHGVCVSLQLIVRISVTTS
jgi:hypothetical protein